MQATSTFIKTLEIHKHSGHAVPIYGHSTAQGLLEIMYQEFRTLYEMGINTIWKLLHTDELTGQYTNTLAHRITNNQLLQPRTAFKITQILAKTHQSNLNEIVGRHTPIFETLIKSRDLSQTHKK